MDKNAYYVQSSQYIQFEVVYGVDRSFEIVGDDSKEDFSVSSALCT